MIITKFESWWVERGKCLFDEKRQGGAKMGWDVIVIKLTTDTGIEGIATCMAARSGAVSESYLQETVAPVVLGRDPPRPRGHFPGAVGHRPARGVLPRVPSGPGGRGSVGYLRERSRTSFI